MPHPDFKNSIVPVEYLESNHDFCKQIVEAYENALDKNNSWYGPKIPFVISMPKLLNNAYAAKKVLRRKKKPMKTLSVQKISRDEIS